MSKVIKTANNLKITVIAPDEYDTTLTAEDIEMDVRVKEAVKSAINRAKICKKPIAKYDSKKKKAYMETSDGEKIYVE